MAFTEAAVDAPDSPVRSLAVTLLETCTGTNPCHGNAGRVGVQRRLAIRGRRGLAATSPTLMHTRIVNNDRMHTSLQKSPSDPLWRHTEWMPSLNSPYFPFRQKAVAPGAAEYERLFDGYTFTRPPPESAA
jgi:hypothetical protein